MNILFIDSKVNDYQVIVNACNANTIPIVYSCDSTRDEIKYIAYIPHKINRIGIFADQKATLFLDNEPFFVENENTLFLSENPAFMVQLIRDYDISYIDYFACNSLNDPKWVNYYEILMSLTNVIVGASNNATGNIQYGGDWIMENTCQDIESIYFSKNIQYYTYLLLNTGFKVGTGVSEKDITDLFKKNTTSGGGGTGKLITSNNTGFNYTSETGSQFDIIQGLDVATGSTLLTPTADQLTGYHIKYPATAGSTTYKDLAYFINLPDPEPVSPITFSGASDISGVVGTNTINSYSSANQIDSSGTLYTFYNNGNSLTNTTGSFTLNAGIMNCYVLLIGPGGSGTKSYSGGGNPGAGGGGILAYFTMIKGVTYNIVIDSGTFSNLTGVSIPGKVSIISNDSIQTVNLVANGSNTNISKSGGVPTVSGTAMSITNYKIYNGADATDTTGNAGNVPISTDITSSTFSTIFVDMMNLIGNQNVAYSSTGVPLGSFNYGFGSSGSHRKHNTSTNRLYPGLGGKYDKGGEYSTNYVIRYSSGATSQKIVGGNGKGYGNGGGVGVGGVSGEVGNGGVGGKGAIFIYLNKDS